MRAVSRNCPCSRLPSMSVGIVCVRSPLATALMTRAISVLGRTTSSIRSLIESSVAAQPPPASPMDTCLTRPSLPTCLLSRRSSRSRRWLDSMMSLIATATWPACPVDVTGMRTLKSPRLTAVSTRSITRLSVLSAAGALVAIMFPSSPFCRCRPRCSRRWYPELNLRAGARFADDAAPTAGEPVREPEIDVGFDARMPPHRCEPVADRFFEADGEVERLGAHRGQQPAERILDLLDGERQLVELRGLTLRVAVVADPLELELSRREELQRIVVQRARESPPRLVATRGHVGEQLAACRHRLLEALERDIELFLGFPVLPHQAGGHRGDVEDPRIVVREATLGVKRRESADAPATCRPRNGDRVANAPEAVFLPEGVERGKGAIVNVELVSVDDAGGDAIASGLGIDANAADGRLRRKAEGLALKHQVAGRRDAEEGHPPGADQAGDRLRQVAEEDGQLHLGLEIRRDGTKSDRGGRLGLLESLRRAGSLACPKAAGGPRARLCSLRCTHRPATGRQGGYLHVALLRVSVGLNQTAPGRGTSPYK